MSRRLPVVGPTQLHTVQLSPEERAILAHRARGAAKRAYAPELRADRRAFGAANRAYKEEKGSILGAASTVDKSINQAIRAAKQSGLQGPYLRELLHSLASKRGQAAEAVPYLLADPAKERREADIAARTELINDRAAMEKSSATALNQLLKEAREAGSSALKEAETHKRSEEEANKPSKEELRKLKNASLALQDALHAWHENVLGKNAKGEEVPLQTLNPLQTPAQWRSFAAGLVASPHYSGFGLAEAMQVIQRYLKQVVEPNQKKLAEGQYSGAYPGNTYAPPIRFNAG